MVDEGLTVILAVVAPVFQRNVPPAAEGFAVRVALEPLQIVTLLTVTVGIVFTVIVPLADELVHPFNVYVTE